MKRPTIIATLVAISFASQLLSQTTRATKNESVDLVAKITMDGQSINKDIAFVVYKGDKYIGDLQKSDDGRYLLRSDAVKNGDTVSIQPNYGSIFRVEAGGCFPVGIEKSIVVAGSFACDFKSVEMQDVTFYLKDQEGQPVKKSEINFAIKIATSKDAIVRKYSSDDDGEVVIPIAKGLEAKYNLTVSGSIRADVSYSCNFDFDQSVTAEDKVVNVPVKKSICTLIVNFKWDPKYSTETFVHSGNSTFPVLAGDFVGQMFPETSIAKLYDVKPGKYVISPHSNTVPQYIITSGSEIEIPANPPVPYEVTVTIMPPVKVVIKGKIVDSEGKPIAKACVWFKTGVSVTEADGLFEVSGFGDEIVVQHAEFAIRKIAVKDLKSDGTINEIRLAPHPLLQGKLNGNAEALASIEMYLHPMGDTVMVSQTKPSADGTFSRRLPAGKYILEIYRTCGENSPKNVSSKPSKMPENVRLIVSEIEIPAEGKTANFDLPNIARLKVKLSFSEAIKKQLSEGDYAKAKTGIVAIDGGGENMILNGKEIIPAADTYEICVPVGKCKLVFVVGKSLAYISDDVVVVKDGENESIDLAVDKLIDVHLGGEKVSILLGKAPAAADKPSPSDPNTKPAAAPTSAPVMRRQ